MMRRILMRGERAGCCAFVAALALCALSAPTPTFAGVTFGRLDLNPLSRGIVGMWSFDGGTINWTSNTLADLSGNGNSGTLVSFSKTTAPTPGMFGQALTFNGSGNYVQIPHNLGVTNAITVSAWIKQNGSSFQYDAGIVAEKIGTDNNVQFTLNGYPDSGTSNQVSAGIYSGGWHRATANYNSYFGKWTQVVGTYDGATIRLYFNGVLAASAAYAGGLPNATDNEWRIGRRWDDTNYVDGAIDEVRIYNRALSASEVALLYASGKVTVGAAADIHQPVGSSPLQSGFVGYWSFDGSTMNWTDHTVSDLSGNGNAGTLTNMDKATSPVVGKIGQGMLFNGSSSYVSLPSGFANFTTGITISVWAKPTTNGSWARFVDLGNGAPSNNILFERVGTSNDLMYEVYGLVSSTNVTATNGLINNQWHHYVVTEDAAGAVVMYRDGLQIATGSVDVPNNITRTLNYIGKSNWNVDAYYGGSMDDVRIYNRALSAAEVAQLYNGSKVTIGRPTNSSNLAVNQGLIGYWSMDSSQINWTSNTMTDLSSQSNTATLVNLGKTIAPTPGKIGQALQFNGSSSYIRPGSFGTPPQSITLSAWIKPNAAGGVVFSELGQSTINYGWHDSQMEVETNGTIKVCVWTGASASCVNAATGITFGTWYHVVSTYDVSTHTLRGYVNGVAGGNLVVTKAYPDTNALYYAIGATDGTNAGNGGYFSGSIDDTRVYNRALSAAEVQQLYMMTK